MSDDESNQIEEFYNKLEEFVDNERKIIWDAEKKLKFLTEHKEIIRLLAMDSFSIADTSISSPEFEKLKKKVILNAEEVQKMLVKAFSAIDISPNTQLNLISEYDMNQIAEEVQKKAKITSSKFADFSAVKKTSEELSQLLKMNLLEKNIVEALEKRIAKYNESLKIQKENIEKEIKELNNVHQDLLSGNTSRMKTYASNLLKIYSDVDSAVRDEQRSVHPLVDELYKNTRKAKNYADTLLNRELSFSAKLKNIISFRMPNAITIDDLKKDIAKLSNPQDVNEYRTLIAYSGLLGKKELRFLRSVEYKSDSLEEKNRSENLHELNQKLSDTKEQSIKDGLTGVYNRRFFDKKYEDIKTQYAHPRRSPEKSNPVSILMIDFDHFKSVNDGFGHKAGDIILTWVAQTIQKTIKRKDDVLARYGGEELVLILPGDDKENATLFAEKLRRKVETESYSVFSKFKPLNQDMAVKKNQTLSIGVASFPEDGNIDEILVLSDKRVFNAKKSGRNRVINQ